MLKQTPNNEIPNMLQALLSVSAEMKVRYILQAPSIASTAGLQAVRPRAPNPKPWTRYPTIITTNTMTTIIIYSYRSHYYD